MGRISGINDRARGDTGGADQEEEDTRGETNQCGREREREREREKERDRGIEEVEKKSLKLYYREERLVVKKGLRDGR